MNALLLIDNLIEMQRNSKEDLCSHESQKAAVAVAVTAVAQSI